MLKKDFKQTEICGERSPKRSEGRSRTISEISKDRKKYKLEELIGSVSDTFQFKEDNVYFLNTSDIYGGKVQNRILREVATLPGQAKKSIRRGDFLFSEIRPANRRFALVDFDSSNYVVSTKLMVLRCSSKIIPTYLKYFLTSREILDYLQVLAESRSGTFPQITFTEIANLDINLPSIDEQRAIAKILSDLDEKIELNHQMNKTLESIAHAIFKRWFVDFKFSRHEKVIFFNGLPDGWRQGTLGEIVTIESGKRPGEKSEIKTPDFSIPLIGASSVMGFVKGALYNEPILIIGRVGTHGVVQRVLWSSFPSDNTLVIRTKYFEFVYQILKTVDYDALNVGTTQPLITQTAINKYSVVIPNDEKLEQFEVYISGLFKKIVANNRESESLVEIRDFLLPRLISGKVRIS